MTDRRHGPVSAARQPLAVVRLWLNWLLVLVLALDLVGSPLHAHAHGESVTVGGVASESLHHFEQAPTVHVETRHDTGPSHSIAALRTQSTSIAQATIEAPAELPWQTAKSGGVPQLQATATPPQERLAPLASVYRSLPPDGRAPPLHG